MILRDAEPLDAGAVGAALTEFAAGNDWFPRLHSAAEDIAHAGQMITFGWVTVAAEGREVLGFLARNGEEINALYVRAAHQRRGVGRALIASAQSEADRLELWTHQANSAAQSFYAAQGFEEAERTDGSKSEEKLPDIKLVWAKEANP